jgi:uncharacterized membrane protein
MAPKEDDQDVLRIGMGRQGSEGAMPSSEPFPMMHTYDSPMDRFCEVDLLRGIAILLMVFYHFAFDLDYFGLVKIDVNSGIFLSLARLTVTLFLLLVGLSLYLSLSQAERLGQRDRFKRRLFRRSAQILALALCITAVTYLPLGHSYIVFGVLHLIGLSLLLAYPVLGMGWKNFIFGSVLIILGLYVPEISVDHYWLLWLGLAPPGFYSLDYVPLLPWFGVVLYGVGLGGLLYPGYRRRLSLIDQLTISERTWIRLLCYLGRNSLVIYLVHQPLIIMLMILAGVPFSGL